MLHAPVRRIRRRSRAAVHVWGADMRARVTGLWRPSRTAVHAGEHIRPSSRAAVYNEYCVVGEQPSNNRSFGFRNIAVCRIQKEKDLDSLWLQCRTDWQSCSLKCNTSILWYLSIDGSTAVLPNFGTTCESTTLPAHSPERTTEVPWFKLPLLLRCSPQYTLQFSNVVHYYSWFTTWNRTTSCVLQGRKNAWSLI